MRRAARVSAKIRGSSSIPRLVVNRTNRYIHAQLIDDTKGRTIAAISTSKISGGAAGTGKTKATKSAQAFTAGEMLAKKAVAAGVTKAVFDRRAYKFHGRVKQLAEGARKGGLTI